MSENSEKPLVAIDLFAGGGGLTMGLKEAGFIVSAAVEIDGEAARTYIANHSEVILFQSDIRAIKGEQLRRTSPTNRIDFLAACPPCQGFSQLTAKYRRNDPRNELLFEVVRLIEELKPGAFMMENVPGLAVKGRLLLNEALSAFREMGYYVDHAVLDVADYGIPQRRNRFVLFGNLQKLVKIPNPTHSRIPTGDMKPWITVRDVLSEAKLGRPAVTSKVMSHPLGPASVNWHVVRNLSEVNVQRLRATKAGQPRTVIPMHLRPICHRDRPNGFMNVYGRMEWDKPAPTITGGCTTLSKGRFGHPSSIRTISVREAALLQTFPRNYIFDSRSIEAVCRIIGNALPPYFATQMARACIQNLRNV